MMSKLLPIILLVLGTGTGIGAGMFLTPGADGDAHGDAAHADEAHDTPDGHGEPDSHAKPKKSSHSDDHGEDQGEFDYVKLNNQFVVPVVENDQIAALVVLSLSLETGFGMREKIYSLEPKLRDSFLQVLFDHANMGGFSGAFTDAGTLGILREALRIVAQNELGTGVSEVLIVDIARQDV